MADSNQNLSEQNEKSLALSREAADALLDGKAYAVRVVGPNPCQWCSDRQGQVLSIWDVINGIADHKNGQCSFLYIAINDDLLDSSSIISVDGFNMLIIDVKER